MKTYKLEFFKIFSEDIFLRPLDDLSKMSELYRKKVNIPFTTTGHPLSVTAEKTKLLKKMNCVSASIALECGNPNFRVKYLNRKYTNKQFGKSIKILQDYGIRAVSLNMIGLPHENRKNIFETIEVNRKYKPDCADFGCFFPFRGTPLGDLSVNDGLAYPEEIKTNRSDHGASILHMENISSDEINGIMKMHYFYLRYSKIFWPIFMIAEKENWFSKLLCNSVCWLNRSLIKLKILEI